MSWIIQSESALNGDRAATGSSATIYITWVAAYTYGSTDNNVSPGTETRAPDSNELNGVNASSEDYTMYRSLLRFWNSISNR